MLLDERVDATEIGRGKKERKIRTNMIDNTIAASPFSKSVCGAS